MGRVKGPISNGKPLLNYLLLGATYLNYGGVAYWNYWSPTHSRKQAEKA